MSGMDTIDITEDAFRAIIETCHRLGEAVNDLTIKVEAQEEAITIHEYEIHDLRQAAHRRQPA